MIGQSILELHETNATDESIKSYEYNEYQPITGTQINSAGQIKITIENQDQFLHLQDSYLLIEGELLKADNARYADADLIALTNNGLLYLFSSLKLTLALTNSGFDVRQQFLIRSPDPNGSFQCDIPMKHIFGFMDDYTKVTYGMRDTLQLIRKGDDDSLLRTAAAGVGKVLLSKLAWSVPVVQPNDVRRVNLYKSIASNNVIPVSFRMRQCETSIVPLQQQLLYGD